MSENQSDSKKRIVNEEMTVHSMDHLSKMD